MNKIYITLLSAFLVVSSNTVWAKDTKSPEQWIEQLSSQDVGQRRSALLALSKLGDAIQPVALELLPLLNDDDGGVRTLAVMALGKIPKKLETHLNALAKAMGDSEWTVRHNASLALGRAGKGGQALALHQLNSEKLEFTHRLHAAQAVMLGEDDHSEGIGKLITQLSLAEEPLADDLLLAVGLVASDTSKFKSLAPQLKQWMHHSDKRVKMRAISALSYMGQVAESEVPTLIQWAQEDESSSFRVAAVNALGNIRNPKETIIPALMQACNDEQYRVYENTASVLASFCDDLVPYATEFLKDTKQPGVKYVLDALLSVRSKNATLIRQVSQLLSHEDWQIQFRAAAALGSIGTLNKQTLESLQMAAKSDNEIVALNAAQSIDRLKVADSK